MGAEPTQSIQHSGRKFPEFQENEFPPAGLTARHQTTDYGSEVTQAMLQTVCPRTMDTSSPLLTEIMIRHQSVVHVPLHTGVGGGSSGKYKFLNLFTIY